MHCCGHCHLRSIYVQCPYRDLLMDSVHMMFKDTSYCALPEAVRGKYKKEVIWLIALVNNTEFAIVICNGKMKAIDMDLIKIEDNRYP